jgi:hypothetical protein
MKNCTRCQQTKPFTEFFKGRINKDGSQGYGAKCKDCIREYQLELYHKMPVEKKRQRKEKSVQSLDVNYFKRYKLNRYYNITLEEYHKMYNDQNGKCYICEKEIFGREVKVDHNHLTGKVRKLLCHNCNTSLGLLNEDVKIFEKCIEYLKTI